MNLIDVVKLMTCKLYNNDQVQLAGLLEGVLADEHILIESDYGRKLAVLLQTGQWDEMLKAAPNAVLAEHKRRLPDVALRDILSYRPDRREDRIWDKAYAISTDLCYPRDLPELRKRVESIKRQLEDFHG
jgi:hypothetical protein